MSTARRIGAALTLAVGSLLLLSSTPAAAEHHCPCPPQIPDPPGTDNPGPLPPIPPGDHCPHTQWTADLFPNRPGWTEMYAKQVRNTP